MIRSAVRWLVTWLVTLVSLVAVVAAGLLPTTASYAAPPGQVQAPGQGQGQAFGSGQTLEAAGTPGTSRATAATTHPIVLVGTGGFTWSDLSAARTPTFWALLQRAAVSTVTVRSVNTNTCPVDAWLSLSAGERAAAAGVNGGMRRDTGTPCPGMGEPVNGQVPNWSDYRSLAERSDFGAEPGMLGDQLAAAGAEVLAVGPGAAIGAATTNGEVAEYLDLATALATQRLPATRVTLVDLGSVRDPDDQPRGEAAVQETLAQQVSALDQKLGELLTRLPADADVLVAGLSDGGRTARLRPVLAAGPDFGAGLLYSPSTRQPRLIQSSDLTVTLLTLAGAEVPRGQGGGVLAARADSDDVAARYRDLVDLDLATLKGHALVPPFFNGMILTQLAIYLGVWALLKGRLGAPTSRRRLLGIVQVVSVAAAAVPVASFLANLLPWWRVDPVMLALVGAVGVFVAMITLVAVAPPAGRHLLGAMLVVSLVSAVVLAADAVTGSRLQLSSMMGLQPVVGGRFYGMGNVTFALFVTSVILAVTVLADALVRRGKRLVAAGVVAAGGLAAAVVDGHPSWGADGGGPPALLPGIAYLVLAVLGVRLTWRKGALIAAVTAGLFLLVGFLDSLRPADKMSHLGRFFESLGTSAALDTINRKLSTNIGNLIGSPLTLLVPVALVFVVYVLLRPTSWGAKSLERSFERAPLLRSGLVAWVIVMILGFALNDSGVAIPATGAMIAIPLVIAVAVATLRDQSRESAR